MSKGIRTNTLDRVLAARAVDELALGPYIGELAIKQAVTPGVLAELVGTHTQTILRWIFGQSEIQPYWLPKVSRVMSLLIWRRMTGVLPLAGTAAQQREQIARDLLEFKAAVKSSGRVLVRSA